MATPYGINLARESLSSGDISLPLNFWPREMYHSEPKDAWDKWENDKFQQSWNESIEFWNKCLSKARRQLKIEKMRQINPLYCNKSERNYQKRFG